MSSQNNDKIVSMLAMSDEMSVLDYKLKQLVEDLQNDERVFATVQDISLSIVNTASKFNKQLNSYKPAVAIENTKATPSSADGVNEKIRVVPTPENWRDFVDTIPEENVDKSNTPTIEELSNEDKLAEVKKQAKFSKRNHMTPNRKKEAYRKAKNTPKAPPKKKVKEQPKKKGFFSR